LSSTVLLFAAEDTPHKLSLQVLFFRSVLRMNQVVLGLLFRPRWPDRSRCRLFCFCCRSLLFRFQSGAELIGNILGLLFRRGSWNCYSFYADYVLGRSAGVALNHIWTGALSISWRRTENL